MPPSTARPPLAGLRFWLVGPGKVGTSLACWAVAAGAELAGTAARDPDRAAALAARLGGAASGLDGVASAGCDLLLVAVADAAVAPVAARLAGRPQAAVALHTAGSLGPEPLAALAAAGSAIGSLHPLKAFPQPLPDAADARGTFFAIDGDGAAQALGARLASAFGGVSHPVGGGVRALYHLAASAAAGGVVTLVASAADLAAHLGLPEAVGRGYLELARGALDAAERGLAAGSEEPVAVRLAEAITGPLARGDVDTFSRELAGLVGWDGAGPRAELLAELARETVRLTAGDGTGGSSRGEETARRLARALAGRSSTLLDPPGGGC